MSHLSRAADAMGRYDPDNTARHRTDPRHEQAAYALRFWPKHQGEVVRFAIPQMTPAAPIKDESYQPVDLVRDTGSVRRTSMFYCPELAGAEVTDTMIRRCGDPIWEIKWTDEEFYYVPARGKILEVEEVNEELASGGAELI